MKYIRILAASLVFLLALLMTGCGEDIYQEYLNADEKMSMLEAVSGSIDYDIEMEAMGITMSVPITADYKARMENNELAEMSMDMSYSLLGQEISASAYIDREYMYIDTLGTKVRMPFDTATASEYESMAEPALPELSEDILKNAERTVENGVVNVSVTFDGDLIKEQLIDMYSNSVSGMSDTGMSAIEDMNSVTDISDVTMKYTINEDGYFTWASLDFGMSMTVEEQEASVKMVMTMTFDNPGQPVEFDIPNADEYTDMSDFMNDDYYL